MEIKKLFNRILLILFLSLLWGNSFGQALDIITQKVNLELKLRERIEKVVGTVVTDDKYVVSVKVTLNPPNKDIELIRYGDAKSGDSLFVEKYNLSSIVETKLPDGNSLEDRIKAINIDITLDPTVLAKRSIIKKLIEKVKAPIAGKTPIIQINPLKIFTPEAPPTPLTLLEKIQRWALALKNPIAVIIAALIISIISLMLMKKFIALGNRALGVVTELFGEKEDEIDMTEEMEEDIDSGDLELTGYKRFEALCETEPEEAMFLLKKWIRSKSEGSAEGLTVIVRQSPTNGLLYFFDNISADERKEWKKVLITDLNPKMLRKGDIFLDSQIIDEFIVPIPQLDAETRKLIADISAEECAACIRADIEVGAILVNVLPVEFIAKTYEFLDMGVITSLSTSGVQYSDELLVNKKEDLKKVLQENFQEKFICAPFLDKIINLMPHVDSEKETAIYESLFVSNEIEVIKETATANFPSQLVRKLSEVVLKKVFMNYKHRLRVEFLLSRDEDDRNFFLNIVGDKTSKVRELLDADLSFALANEGEMKKIEKKKDNIWNSFIQFIRVCARKDQEIADDIASTIDEWIEENSKGASAGGDNVVSINEGEATEEAEAA